MVVVASCVQSVVIVIAAVVVVRVAIVVVLVVEIKGNRSIEGRGIEV